MPLSEGSKARVQLEAEFLNSLAGNIAVVGLVTPIFGIAFGQVLTINLDLAASIWLGCIALAAALHVGASWRLRTLDK